MRERSIRFHERWFTMASESDDATRLKVYDMIMGYAFNGAVPTDTDLSLLFLSVKAEIDEDRKREEELHSVRSRVGKAGIEKRWKNARIAKIANDSKNSNCYTCYDLLSNKPQSTQSPTEIKEEK